MKRIDITNFEHDYVEVDFEEDTVLVNLRFVKSDIPKLKKIVEELEALR